MEGDILPSVQLSIIDDAQLLVCSRDDCRIALSPTPSGVTEHLRSRHQIPAERRKQVTYTLRRSDLRLKEPTSVEPRPDGVLIDSRLRCYDGFLCDLCPFRTISKPMMARHLSREHFRATTGRWARSHATTASSYMPVYLQAWVRNPPRSQYWTVSLADAATTEVRPVGRDEELRHLHDVLAREEAFRRRISRTQGRVPCSAAQGASSNNTAAAYTELRPWLERTGWERVYANVDRQLLYSLTLRPVERSYRPLLLSAGLSQHDNNIVSPADDEAKIAALCHAAYNFISRCEETAKTSSRNSLCWLRNVHPSNCNPKPFTLVAKKNTRERYVSVLQRFVSLIFRVYRLSANLRRDAAGVSLTKEHWVACGKVWNHPGLNMKTPQRGEWESLNTGITADCACEDMGEVSERDGWEEDGSDLDDQQSLASSSDDEGSQFSDVEESFCDDSSQNECDSSTNTQYPSTE
ncbi:hypothetical protein BDP81DRAFT_432330 [Colletotrichum phormii]|uniref:C2H2-type domain-containing protein n=1 Tax=Colletotrichum phormii TaxID=359342 RepID=A0AAI9ZN11_9PEZI|nr:uncharacterized protein BDP81DRAFT_432330 [Colletotrichum phormii]KAK1634969.1 hypothetical protein BDP81DRAFT_432330 [Colletotrichum phormii]